MIGHTFAQDMDASALHAELLRKGIRVDTDGSNLIIDAPRNSMPPELVEEVRQRKSEIIRIIKAQEASWIVPIRPNGDRPPLFCIHGFAGSVFFYRHVSRHLHPSQPVYGLQSGILDGKPVKERTVEEVAAHYLAEVCAIEPKGPYLLVAHCAGGYIAFEMAQQLVKQGKSVAFLGLLDVIPPTVRPDYSRHFSFRTRLERVNADGGLLAVLRWAPSAVWSGIYRRVYPRRKSRFDKVVGDICARFDLQVPTWARENYSKRTYEDMIMRYNPQVYNGKVTLVRGLETQEMDLGADLGWRDIAMAGVDEYEVPFSHVDMVTDVDTGAPHLAAFLEERLAGIRRPADQLAS